MNTEDGTDLDISSNYEWLPENYSYLALLWIKISDYEEQSFFQNIKTPSGVLHEEWASNICSRVLSLNECSELIHEKEVYTSDLINELSNHTAEFCKLTKINGLSKDQINELVDCWSSSLEEAKTQYAPEGKPDKRLQFLLSRDQVTTNSSNSMLMLPSHPLRLRWISKYLAESEKNARQALSGKMRLNEKNDKLYLDWVSNLSPHQQPPVATSPDRSLLFSTGELGWCEEFTPLDTHNQLLAVASLILPRYRR